MGGLLLVGLFLTLCSLVAKLWPLLVAALAVYLLWRLIIHPLREARAGEMRDRLRHERARREIDRIALEASRAMYGAASSYDEVIEGTAVEVDRR